MENAGETLAVPVLETWWERTDTAVLTQAELKQRTTVYAHLRLEGKHWLSDYSKVNGGYAKCTIKGVSNGGVLHKVMWQWLIGPIPLGLTLDHRCNELDDCPGIDNGCCNPQHIEIVSEQENSRRRILLDRGLMIMGYGTGARAVAPTAFPPRETWVKPVMWARDAELSTPPITLAAARTRRTAAAAAAGGD